MTFPVIDAHQHVWDPGRARYDWLGPELAPIDRAMTFEEVDPELRAAGVDLAVLVQSADDPDDTHLMRECAARHAEVAGIVGFATIGPSRDADADPSVGELMSIYVAPAAWRRGVGTELMSWVTAEAAARHWSALTLWTIEANRGTRAFYERCGWAHDGSAKRERFAGQMLSQVRYAWRLSVSDSDRVLASGDA